MLKLLIVDDEEIICKTIARVIDWSKLGISLVGTCFDGVEAYHAILDESPDIVMTDIRMPGISGLELIERIYQTNLHTQFIILTGYSEFEYAKRAMKCGIRHYLLKPCDKDQIIDCVKDVVKDCIELKNSQVLKAPDNTLINNLHYTLMHNIIGEGIACPCIEDSFFDSYEKYLDLTDTPYQYCCIYYLERENLKKCLAIISEYFKAHAPQLVFYRIYISNIFVLFFPNYSFDYQEMDRFLRALSFSGQSVSIKYERTSYPDLKSLLRILISKLKRYDMLYFADEGHLISNFNYDQIVSRSKALCSTFKDNDRGKWNIAKGELNTMLSSLSSREFLLQISTQILIDLGTQTSSWEMTGLAEFLSSLQLEPDCTVICSLVTRKIDELTSQSDISGSYSPFIKEIFRYLDEHIADSNLTLKWIAENHLYMNVNYVSRCFIKETQQKFSSYLMELRVKKAKEIFDEHDDEKIQNVAELVGCGNNPYYFSKIFKKCTGITPTAYIRRSKNMK